MKILNLFAVLLICFSFLNAQNSTPEVTNVTFSQRIDGTFMVDVYYDLFDADADTMLVEMEASEDNGTTWTFPCEDISGDVGSEILSGVGKHIIWDFGAEHPQIFGEEYKIKIIADDGDSLSGTVIDIDGNVYQTIKIGNQWWMAENLKVTHYNNGDTLPNVPNNSSWMGTTNGAYCAYGNNNGNIDIYGLLYNFYTIDDDRNIAPQGWHVPTEDEWQELEMYLGMDSLEVVGYAWRGTDEGGKLKEEGTIHWNNPNTGATNSSGFTALPGGYRLGTGIFFDIGNWGIWWSATLTDDTHAWTRGLNYNYAQVYRYDYYVKSGYSIRCIMD